MTSARYLLCPAVAALLLLLGADPASAQERDAEPAATQERDDADPAVRDQDADPGPRYLRSEDTREAGLPFSDAVRVGDMLYLSGVIGITPGGTELVAGGIAAETRQAMENIRAVLEENGSSLDRVVKCTIMLADMAEWPEMNEVYVTFFQENLPARSAFGTDGLALDARVEIECLAAAG